MEHIGESDKISSCLRNSYLAMLAKEDWNKTAGGKGEEVGILSLFTAILFPILSAATACNIKVKKYNEFALIVLGEGLLSGCLFAGKVFYSCPGYFS